MNTNYYYNNNSSTYVSQVAKLATELFSDAFYKIINIVNLTGHPSSVSSVLQHANDNNNYLLL